MTHGNQAASGLSAAERSAFRSAAGRFATGVVVVTSLTDDVPLGVTVNAFSTVSLDPLLVLVSLQNTSRMLSAIEQSEIFAVTVLAGDQKDQAGWFANPRRPTGLASFGGETMFAGPATGCPVLAEGLAFFDCRLHAAHPSGDHVILVGEVLAFDQMRRAAPLLFANGEFGVGDQPSADAVFDRGVSTAARALSVTTRR
ncbi:flavin reductase family protein [Streptomyces sp. NPDC004327]|uniref:flavin reductase family protein n=1 Tax=unclassified Streptomyces TaxID=2593676 RepID=UPI00367C4BF1